MTLQNSKIKDVIIGKGNLDGKGVYANRDFTKGEVVIKYNLKPLTENECKKLQKRKGGKGYLDTHIHWGQIYLYSEPEKYVNHSKSPNTYQDLKKQQDIALRNIKAGEMITTDNEKDDIS